MTVRGLTVPAEKNRLMRDRWQALDSRRRTAGQALGQKFTGSGATIGLHPRCDFDCRGSVPRCAALVSRPRAGVGDGTGPGAAGRLSLSRSGRGRNGPDVCRVNVGGVRETFSAIQGKQRDATAMEALSA